MGHDATAALVDGSGHVVAAMAEERLTRIKYHTGFPYQAVEEVLRIGGVDRSAVKTVAVATKHLLYPGMEDYNRFYFLTDLEVLRRVDLFNNPQTDDPYAALWRLFKENVRRLRVQANDAEVLAASERLTRETLRRHLDELGFAEAGLQIYDHHHTHAASAYFTSGVERALVVTIDGAGDGLCASTSLAAGGRLTRLSSAPSGCSPGRFYSEVTRFLGYKRNRHEGKITGLAAFGEPHKYAEALRPFLRFDAAREAFTAGLPQDTALLRKLKTVRRILNNENFGNPYIDGFYEFLKTRFDPDRDATDLAAAAQAVLEEAVSAYVKHFLARNHERNLLLAGGVFANVRVNQRLGEIGGLDFIYIHQNMGDGGCALGAALSHLHEAEGVPYRGYRPTNVYFGRSFTDYKIEQELRASGLDFRKVADVETQVAQLVHAGRVVGRFDGAMEYGPRALGNRSILARTTDRSINSWLNRKLGRTEFMPFAPSVLEAHAGQLFVDGTGDAAQYASHFMTITYVVRSEWRERLQAATHVDGTARPQVVTREQNPSYHRILTEYHRLSGIPGVINTSFNMHEEPIVASPEDALRTFKRGAIDCLAIGPFLCHNNERSCTAS
jgi:carbamoyltransferase